MDKVLEIGSYSAGFCGRLFVQNNNAVTRVEIEQPAAWASDFAMSLFLHAGKRRLHVSLKDLSKLAAEVDVVIIEAASADQALALGFEDWDTPIKVVITPFGLTGPKSNWRATPHTLLAMGGYTQIIGDAGKAPLSLPGHYVEFQAAQFAFTAAYACRLVNESKQIDVSMYESLLALSQFTTVMWSCAGQVRSRHGSDFHWVVPSNLFACSDGWVYINTVPTFWDQMTIFLGLPELIIDSRFSDNDQRMQNRDALHELIATALLPVSKDEIRARASAARIPAGVVQTFGEVLADEHLKQRDYWQQLITSDKQYFISPSLGYRINQRPQPQFKMQEIMVYEDANNE
jgi:crotonobetainyl-CoA:carnitine CoA-transferase CaiB-like acyl-CoA transferase